MSAKISEINVYFKRLERFERIKACSEEREKEDKLMLAKMIAHQYNIKNEGPEKVIGMMHKRREYDIWKGNGQYYDHVSCFNQYIIKKYYRDETPFRWRWQFAILSNIESALEKGERLRSPVMYIGEWIRSTMLPSSFIRDGVIMSLEDKISQRPRTLAAIEVSLMRGDWDARIRKEEELKNELEKECYVNNKKI
jgi:hypothetical protein